MKKYTRAILLAAALLALSSCGESTVNSDETTETLGSVTDASTEAFDYMTNDLSGYIKIGNYKGLTVSKASDILTDEEFENEIAAMLDNYSYYEEFTDRAVADGDSVRADYAGYRDGVAFDGGTATDVTLTAAADTGYIPGFAEAFIGQTPGVPFSFHVTFPADYDNAELAGVEVTFECTVHAILGDTLITPELTDAFVADNFGYSNTEEFRIAFRDTVEAQKTYYVKSDMYSDLWLQVVANAEVLSYPETEVNRIYAENRQVYEQYAAYYGTDYETFLKSYVNMTDEQLLEESRTYVKEDLVMYQLIKDLGITLSDEEFAEGLAFFAEYNGMSTEEMLGYYGESTIRATVIWQKLMDVIAADANIVTE